MKAFPATFETKDVTIMNGGMDLRDYFAAKAMVALYTSMSEWIPTGSPRDEKSLAVINEMAIDAYQFADAMMKAREVK